MSFADAKHRPHAIHTGEEPQNPITNGPESLSVTLDRWGPVDNLFTSMYDALQANWGESPSRTILRDAPASREGDANLDDRVDDVDVSFRTGWYKLTSNERDYVESCFAGKTLQQVLEGVTFDFCIDGVSRAFTHQNVRTRLGAGFMQHGGRDNDWRHRPWTMPETMRRMCETYDAERGIHPKMTDDGRKVCVTNWAPVERFLDVKRISLNDRSAYDIRKAIEDHIMNGRQLYAALVDSGIPWQDARRVLFMGLQTYIHDQYNYLALQGVLANRLEHIMDWEFNCVAQLMLREIRMKCPPILSKYLGSHSDKTKMAKFAGLESWPPDGKYPSPYETCGYCGHNPANHVKDFDGVSTHLCEVCAHNKDAVNARDPHHDYTPKDLLARQHRPEQMPFFVLHPDSMAGGPIRWIPTNGKYPHDVIAKETK